MRSPQRILLLTFLAMPGMGLLTGLCGCGDDVNQASTQDLAKQLESADPDEMMEISRSLAGRGDSAIPELLDAFQKSSQPSVQLVLAETVYRMPPSAQRGAALKKMEELAQDPATRQTIARFAADTGK